MLPPIQPRCEFCSCPRLPGILICAFCSSDLNRKLPQLKSKAIHILEYAEQPTIVNGYYSWNSLNNITLSILEMDIDGILYQIKNNGKIDMHQVEKAQEAIRFVDNAISRFDLILLKYS